MIQYSAQIKWILAKQRVSESFRDTSHSLDVPLWMSSSFLYYMKSGTWAETTLLIRWICIIGDDPRQFMIDFTSGKNLFHSSCSQRIWACVISLFTWIWALALYATDFKFSTELSLKHRVSSWTYQRFSFLLPVNKKGQKKKKKRSKITIGSLYLQRLQRLSPHFLCAQSRRKWLLTDWAFCYTTLMDLFLFPLPALHTVCAKVSW